MFWYISQLRYFLIILIKIRIYRPIVQSTVYRRQYYYQQSEIPLPSDVIALSIRKKADLSLQLWVGTFPIRNPSIYKSLHQSFFYSFITILSSESGVTLEYSTIFTQALSFCHVSLFFNHLSRDFEKTTITAMYMYLYKYVEDTNTGFNSTGDDLHI